MSTLVITEQEKTLQTEIAPVVAKATALIIKTPEQSITAQEDLKENKAKQKKIKEFFKPMKDAAKAAHQAICDRESQFLTPLEQAEEITKGKVITFTNAENKRRADEEAKAEAKRKEDERKERERLEEQAKKAREAGKVEKAEALEVKAENVAVAPVFTPPAPSIKNQGSSFKSVWRGEVSDIKLLCQSIIDGRCAVDVITPNQSAINKLASVCKDSMKIPGLAFKEETQMSVRS